MVALCVRSPGSSRENVVQSLSIFREPHKEEVSEKLESCQKRVCLRHLEFRREFRPWKRGRRETVQFGRL